ncbi:MAG: glycosyltransferase [Candidatus Curtissbacteria bacterium]|nr:glycosyltransferase [Candidatus Curtissbacteria bacterium]
MKVALVHDYLGEFGGAERVLLALSEIWPNAPIYTAFYRKDSPAYARFKGRKIITSWAQKVPFFNTKLHSPLRFLAPKIWNSFDFSNFDVVITSSSWYVTKGVKKGPGTIEICYCHTPPRYLYGYPTSVEWQKYFLVRMYALFINHYMRIYDFEAAQRVDYFIANSQNVARRIKKFYRRDADVIYPPVDLPKAKSVDSKRSTVDGGYFLVVSRIVGGKGLKLAVEAANKLNVPLKVIGKPAGYASEESNMKKIAGKNVDFLGYVSDRELAKLYAGARAFLALATDEDFGITPVEAMLCGTPVIAYRGGGYLETVIDGKTGVFFEQNSVESLTGALNSFMKLEKKGTFDSVAIKRHAKKFGKERFKEEILEFVESKVKNGK